MASSEYEEKTLTQFALDAKRTLRVEGLDDEFAKANYCVLGATHQMGALAGYIGKKLRDKEDYISFDKDVFERLGHAMWYIANVANSFNMNLSDIAKNNLEYTLGRWGETTASDSKLEDFEDGCREEERIPNTLLIEFRLKEESGIRKVEVFVYEKDGEDPIPFGDPIDNNSWNPDDRYHFHDIYHFAYVAFFGWSPVVRKLLDRKRKSNPDVDRIEDGARARDSEEAITTFMYEFVKRQNYFKENSYLDSSTLGYIRILARDLEVKSIPSRIWEEAIKKGAEIERELAKNAGGWVIMSRNNSSLTYYRNRPSLAPKK